MVVDTIPPSLEPIISGIQNAVGFMQIALGGIFGLYLLLVILKWWESRKLVKIMKDIREEVRGISHHMGVKKEQKVSLRKRVAHKILRIRK